MGSKKKFFETPEFKADQAKWYARLEAEGFEDIEKGETETVIRPQIIKTQKSQYAGGNDYWELCQEILRSYRFKKEIHRTIFELHTNGRSVRDIVDDLKQKHRAKFSKTGINDLILRVKEDFLRGGG